MKPVVSIIITLYNYADYIGECLQSCIDQTFSDIEIIVVDDCSTDRSIEIVQQYHNIDKRIRIFTLPVNHGYSYAKNYGIKMSNGKYIALIDADDKLTQRSIEWRCDVLQKRPKIEMVHGIALRWYGGCVTRGFNKKTYIHAQGRMYRRQVYEQYGLYCEQLRAMADKEFVYRIGVHPDSPFPKLVKDKRIKKVVALYRKHDVQMHRRRKRKPAINKIVKKLFNRRINQLLREGITKENTEYL